ncbi:MAG: hypothetical protein IH991_00005 [Planctomycetes bacterium]|nr:hypothetical protein [Planctomycetota bacterium]
MFIRTTLSLFCFLMATQSVAAYDWVKSPHDNNPAVAKIEAALDENTKIDFIEVPLQDVMDYLADVHKIPIVIDARALNTVGLGTDTPITRRLGISLRSALRLLLDEIELTYLIRDEVLLITSLEEADRMAEIRVYDVADLLEKNEPADHLAQTILTALRVPTGNGKRGDADAKPRKSPRQITAYRTTLMVRDTLHGHAEVTQLIAALKESIAPAKPTVPEDPTTTEEPKIPEDPKKTEEPKTP